MGLLDVNMPMLYGEGKKAFHRLQLEIIRSSNDQSIFAWGRVSDNVRIGSILADDPSSFRGCSNVELLDYDEFVRQSKQTFPGLRSMDADDGVFPVTNRGIQIRMLLHPYPESKSVFRAYLPCRVSGFSVTINLVLWNSNYYRYPHVWSKSNFGDSPEFRQVYLRYQDTLNHAVTFDIDDSGLTENGFICSNKDSEEHIRNTFMLTNANPFCLKTYSAEQGNCHFKVVFGQCFGRDWVHVEDSPLSKCARMASVASISRGPDWALSLSNSPPADVDSSGKLWIRHFHFPGSPWVVRTYRVVWERSKIEVRMDVFRDPHFRNGLDEWKVYEVEVSDFSCTWIITVT